MIGVIPAAGEGKRLGLGVKALVKVKGRHLIEYPLNNLIQTKIKRAVIIEHDRQISPTLGDKYKGLKLEYVSQSARRGIADAILQAKPIVGGDDVFIILGDIVYRGYDLADMITRFRWGRDGHHCIYGMKLVKDKEIIKQSYGFIPSLGGVRIIEKPKDVSRLTPFMGLGIYVASNKLFDYILKTPKSDLRNEVEITDTLDLMATQLRATGHILGGRYVNINTRLDIKAVERYF